MKPPSFLLISFFLLLFFTFNTANSTMKETAANETRPLIMDTPWTTDVSFYCACLMVLLCLVGYVGNGISIYVFSRAHMRSSINLLLLGLAATDFSLILLFVPIFALPALTYNVHMSNFMNDFLDYMVVYGYPVATILQFASIWIFMVITAERYLAVCHPLKVAIYCTNKRAVAAMFIVVFLSTAYNFVRFWEYDLESCTDGVGQLSNSSCQGTVSTVGNLKTNAKFWLYYGTISYTVTNFALPLLIIASLNTSVVIRINAAKRERQSLTTSEKSEHKTAIMMITIVVFFVFCYALSFILNIYEAVDPDLFFRPSTAGHAYVLNDLSNTFVVSNSSLTWLIYVIFSKRYRLFIQWLMIRMLPQRLRLKFMTIELETVCRGATFSMKRTNNYSQFEANRKDTIAVKSSWPQNNQKTKQNTRSQSSNCRSHRTPLRGVRREPMSPSLKPLLLTSTERNCMDENGYLIATKSYTASPSSSPISHRKRSASINYFVKSVDERASQSCNARRSNVNKLDVKRRRSTDNPLRRSTLAVIEFTPAVTSDPVTSLDFLKYLGNSQSNDSLDAAPKPQRAARKSHHATETAL